LHAQEDMRSRGSRLPHQRPCRRPSCPAITTIQP